MPPTLGGGRYLVLEKVDLGAQRGRGGPGQLAEVPVEVRLVEVPAGGGDLGQGGAGRRAEQVDRALEPQHPAERLGGKADLLAEAGGQVTVAPAGTGGQLGDADATTGAAQLPPGPADLRPRARAPVEALGQRAVQQREPAGPTGRPGQRLDQP